MNYFFSVILLAINIWAQNSPDIDNNNNMNGEVEIFQDNVQPGSIVSLSEYRGWASWGAKTTECIETNDFQLYMTRNNAEEISSGWGIQHCHGPTIYDPGISTTKGSFGFTWNNGDSPQNATNSKTSFYVEHKLDHVFPVYEGESVNFKIWLNTVIGDNELGLKETHFRVLYYPGWDIQTPTPDNPSKENQYVYLHPDAEGGDFVYTVNIIDPSFTGAIMVDLCAGDCTYAQTNHWVKTAAIKEGHSDGKSYFGGHLISSINSILLI